MARNSMTSNVSEQRKKSREWIPMAFFSTICFAIRGNAANDTAERGGPVAIFYFSTGPILLALVYLLVQSSINSFKPNGKFWVDWNLVKDGQIKKKNLMGFILFCLINFIGEYLLITSLWFSGLANINAGVITVIWSITPLIVAIADYFML